MYNKCLLLKKQKGECTVKHHVIGVTVTTKSKTEWTKEKEGGEAKRKGGMRL